MIHRTTVETLVIAGQDPMFNLRTGQSFVGNGEGVLL